MKMKKKKRLHIVKRDEISYNIFIFMNTISAWTVKKKPRTRTRLTRYVYVNKCVYSVANVQNGFPETRGENSYYFRLFSSTMSFVPRPSYSNTAHLLSASRYSTRSVVIITCRRRCVTNRCETRRQVSRVVPTLRTRRKPVITRSGVNFETNR